MANSAYLKMTVAIKFSINAPIVGHIDIAKANTVKYIKLPPVVALVADITVKENDNATFPTQANTQVYNDHGVTISLQVVTETEATS